MTADARAPARSRRACRCANTPYADRLPWHFGEVRPLGRRLAGARHARLGVDDDVAGDEPGVDERREREHRGRRVAARARRRAARRAARPRRARSARRRCRRQLRRSSGTTARGAPASRSRKAPERSKTRTPRASSVRRERRPRPPPAAPGTRRRCPRPSASTSSGTTAPSQDARGRAASRCGLEALDAIAARAAHVRMPRQQAHQLLPGVAGRARHPDPHPIPSCHTVSCLYAAERITIRTSRQIKLAPRSSDKLLIVSHVWSAARELSLAGA